MIVKINTKQRILKTATLLFAEHGYHAVTVRMIAQKANVSHGLVTYHFKNKGEIYFEVIRHAYRLEEALTYDKILKEQSYLIQTDAGKAYIIQQLVQDHFRRHVFFDEPWRRQLILREVFNNSPIYEKLVKELLRKELESRIEFYQLLKPDASLEETIYWSHIPEAQGLYYLMAWPVVQHYYDMEVQKKLTLHITHKTARTMIEMLELPVPEILQ